MKTIYFITISIVFLCFVSACKNVTYIPKSKKKQSLATPSVLIFDRMVDFRIEQGYWPNSLQEFTSKGIKYYDVMKDFKYLETSFKIKDSNRMVFYFSNHIKDEQRYKETKEIDLNSYSGSAKFWKENNKFIWSIKMN